jgi:hypothetical protein
MLDKNNFAVRKRKMMLNGRVIRPTMIIFNPASFSEETKAIMTKNKYLPKTSAVVEQLQGPVCIAYVLSYARLPHIHKCTP